jgi:hypothetical protein
MLQSWNKLLRKLCFRFIVVAWMIKDLDDWLWAKKIGRPVTETQDVSARTWRKQRGLGPRFHSGNIFKEKQGTQTNKGKQRTIYKLKGGKLKIWSVKRIETRQDYRLGYIDTHLWPLTTLCDNTSRRYKNQNSLLDKEVSHPPTFGCTIVTHSRYSFEFSTSSVL